MIVAAHQPAYLPWTGYLHKVARADLFVVMDDLQYEAQNFQNRNRLKVNNGVVWLTVPLVRGAQVDRICDKRIQNHSSPKESWQRRSWKTFTTHYGRAPFFAHYAGELEEVYRRAWSSLLELDLHLMRLMLKWLDIKTPLVLASTLRLSGEKTARIVQMCQRVGASVYLSGKGGSAGYLELDRFDRAGIEVAWQQFAHPVYPQRYPALGFVPRLSALDMILNCGPRARLLLEQADQLVEAPLVAAGGAA
jgi:hypothetical protein